MARVDGDDVELTARDAEIVKGMLARGDHQHHVAAWFGVDSRAISNVSTGKTFAGEKAAPPEQLPPPGPYRSDPTFVRFYQIMTRVDRLWQQRRMREAKALMEISLKSPVMSVEQTDEDRIVDEVFRDEYGVIEL